MVGNGAKEDGGARGSGRRHKLPRNPSTLRTLPVHDDAQAFEIPRNVPQFDSKWHGALPHKGTMQAAVDTGSGTAGANPRCPSEAPAVAGTNAGTHSQLRLAICEPSAIVSARTNSDP